MLYDLGSAGAPDIVTSARGVCEVVFICDPTRPAVARELPALHSVGSVVEVPDCDPDSVTGIVRALGADGVVTFSEYQLELTAAVAERCGFAFHDRATAAVLTDKYRQRTALAAAGIDTTRCVVLGSADELASTLRYVGRPAVLKPRRGAGSRDTLRITGEADEARAAEVVARSGAGAFVVEELLQGDPGAAGPAWGDYVSVESVTAGGETHHVCVTGKFPLAEPFRETGQFVPATLSPALAGEVTALTGAALDALGVRAGVTHTEIKLTRSGPRIIEVNGRLGGYVGDIVRRASGYDLLRAAIQVAARRPVPVSRPVFDRVAFRRYLPAPAHRATLTALRGIPELRRVRGVDHVEIRAEPGRTLDPDGGTQDCLGVVYGTAENHAELLRTIDAISETVDPVYDAAPLVARS